MTPILYYVDPGYLKQLNKIDYRVPVKFNGRPFAGLLTNIQNQLYVIPLTSETTQKRALANKGKRKSFFTVYVKDNKGVEISNLLLNNMIPVKNNLLTKIDFDSIESSSYLNMEVRFLRKNWDDIMAKADKVYNARYNQLSPMYKFAQKICCDFKLLEKECKQYP